MNAPLPRSRYGKQYDENYERIFGVKSHAKTEAETIKKLTAKATGLNVGKFTVISFARRWVADSTGIFGENVYDVIYSVEGRKGENKVTVSER